MFDFVHYLLIRNRLLSSSKLLGRWGEKRAVKYLKDRGYKVLALNFRYSHYEIDIAAVSPQGSIVFIEVKTRRNENRSFAWTSVNARKKKMLSVAGSVFVKKYSLQNMPVRYDVITIVLNDKSQPALHHYENAF